MLAAEPVMAVGPRPLPPLARVRPMAQLAAGDQFPDLTVESPDGPVELRERWREGPLVVAFMRHFG